MDAVSVSASVEGVLDIALCGEIDYTNAESVHGAIGAAVGASAPAAIRIDMAGVTFLDSSGIAVLVKAMKAAREAGAQFRVDGARPKVFDQLQMTGLTDLFPVQPPAPAPPAAAGAT